MSKNYMQVPKGDAQPFHRQLETAQLWRAKCIDLFWSCKAMHLQSCPTAEVVDISSLLPAGTLSDDAQTLGEHRKAFISLSERTAKALLRQQRHLSSPLLLQRSDSATS